jgi:hypothetical protein
LHRDGTVRLGDRNYSSLSATATAVSGNQEAGWEYWAGRRNSELVSLYELRRRFVADSDGSA